MNLGFGDDMKIELRNGNIINTIDGGEITRGNRYYIRGYECIDTETGDIVFAEVDVRKIERYIPMYLFYDYFKEEE